MGRCVRGRPTCSSACRILVKIHLSALFEEIVGLVDGECWIDAAVSLALLRVDIGSSAPGGEDGVSALDNASRLLSSADLT